MSPDACPPSKPHTDTTMRHTLALTLTLLLTAATAEPAHAIEAAGTTLYAAATDTCHSTVGLVLSGGGAKGIAHIGVIQALEENDIPIDYITGTSMGAIVGGLYAAGYTPDEMLRLILSEGFSYWSTGQIDPRQTFYFNHSDPNPAMLSVPIAPKERQAQTPVPASLISPIPMNFAFMELFSAYTAQCGGDFDKLFVPFRCVAADVGAKRKTVLRGGSLGDAIRASMSFPIVFQATTIDGRLLYDGGIYDNFPFDVMREDFAPSIMLGVDVSTPSEGPQTSIMEQIDNLVIQASDHDLPSDEGIRLHIDLRKFNLLDFAKAREIYTIGYNRAMQAMDSIKSRVASRTPAQVRHQRRNAFKAHSPHLRFDSVTVTGGSPRQNQYITYLFTHNTADTFGIERARESYYRAVSSGKLRDLHPQALRDGSTGLFRIDMQASVKDDFKVGFGGYITSSSNSYIFLSAGYSTLSFSSLGASINGWIGQSTMAGSLNGRVFLRTRTPSAIEIQGVASRSKYYNSDHLFYDDSTPTFIVEHEYFGRLQWSLAAGSLAKFDIGAGYGHIYNRYYPNNRIISYERGHDRTYYNLAQAYAAISSSTLDNTSFPTKGSYYFAKAMAVAGDFKLKRPVAAADPATAGETAETEAETMAYATNPIALLETQRVKWLQLEMRTRNYFGLNKHFTLGIESDVMLSTRKLTDSYGASVTGAPGYSPTPSSNNAFIPAFHANSFIAAGIIPVYRFNDNLSARIQGHCFMPLRKIREADATTDRAAYGRWFSDPEFFGELDITYRFPFASLTGYCNYSTSSGSNWNVGISFGIFLLPPKFLR